MAYIIEGQYEIMEYNLYDCCTRTRRGNYSNKTITGSRKLLNCLKRKYTLTNNMEDQNRCILYNANIVK